MKKVAKFISEKNFKILILLATFPMLIPFVHDNYGSFVKLALAFGILVCCIELFTNKLFVKIKNRANVCLLAFSCSYVVTIILNRQNCFSQNVNQLIYMVVFFLLLFMVNDVDEKSLQKEISCISWIVIMSSMIIIAFYLLLSEDSLVPNANVIGQVAALSIILSLWGIATYGASIISIVLLLNICFQAYALSLSASRGSIVSLVVAIIVYVVIYGKQYYKNKNNSVAVFSAPITINLFAENALSESNRFIQLTTGRGLLWLAGLASFLEAPLFGLTREGSVSSILNNIGFINDGTIHYSRSLTGGVHNGYITTLVSSGIIGFIILMLAFFFVAYDFIYVIKSRRDFSNEFIVALCITIFFLFSELVENRILYQVSAFNAVFWIYFGYFYYFVRKNLTT